MSDKRSEPLSLSQEDVELFRTEVTDVQPLGHDRAPPHTLRPPPVPFRTMEDEHNVLADMLSDDTDLTDLETGDELLFARDGVPRKTMRKLRRGQYSVEAELDLHGMSVAQARDALSVFLKECQTLNTRCVRIIHGKGLGSRHGVPIIKGKLDRWLRLRKDVVAFSSARSVDGGRGAVYVLLSHG